jgi:hypothetical protein
MSQRSRWSLAAALFAVHGAAAAFTFDDGTTVQCFVGGVAVPEVAMTASLPPATLRRVALTERIGSGYRILWNEAQLKGLPREMHDFIFFHECAHASVPTQNEVTANCVGLQAMRAAGRAGFAVESKLAAFYGPDSQYWRETLACANAFKEAPAKAPK